MEEASQPDPFQYPSYNAFFTRTLKASCRPIAQHPHDFISPVDGYIGESGFIQNAQLIQAKGHYFTVDELLGVLPHPDLAQTKKHQTHLEKTLAQERKKLAVEAARFKQGSFITLYLAPHNYHRVHMPVEGPLSQMMYIPGRLFSVDFKTCATVPRLFARNERVVSIFDTPLGKMAVIFVGAMIVGSIETVWAGTVGRPNTPSVLQHWSYASGVSFKRGEEIGLFKLGSTVIVLLEHQTLLWDPRVVLSHAICMGQKIATIKPL